MNFLRLHLVLISILFSALTTKAQSNDTQEIKACIELFFKGMAESDTSLIRAQTHEDLRLCTLGIRNAYSISYRNEGSIDEFLNSIAGIPKGSLEERLLDIRIETDGILASVWTPYEFYYQGKLSHIGVNAFQLVKIDNTWEILQITDTRKKSTD